MLTAATWLWGEPADVMSLSDISERTVTLGAATPATVAALDGERVFLAFAIGSLASPVSVSTRPAVAVGEGFQVDTNSPTVMSWRDYGPLVQQEWTGITGAGGTILTVFEIFYRRRRQLRSERDGRETMNRIAWRRVLDWCKGR